MRSASGFAPPLSRVSWVICAAVCLGAIRAEAQTVLHTVSTSTDFVNAIADVNSNPTADHRIEITGTITMLEQVQAIDISGELTVIGVTPTAAIDGGGTYRPFFL